jgi:hypothetical protein
VLDRIPAALITAAFGEVAYRLDPGCGEFGRGEEDEDDPD